MSGNVTIDRQGSIFGVEPSSGGSNQLRVRAYNERLVLDLVRRHGNLSKAEISRLSGLSAQTISVIMRALELDGLLKRGKPNRGKVGQPSVPMSLNPDSVYSIGIKIGRRSIDIVLVDFIGTIRHRFRQLYAYPMLKWIIPLVQQGILEIESKLSGNERSRIAGVGVATPFELWNWSKEVGAPQGELDEWRTADLRKELMGCIDYPIFLQNDATSACGAELVFGSGPQHPDFLYLFIGCFIGGGVVLNSAVFTGRTGTAGAIGPLPVQGPDGKPRPLLKIASIIWLEQELQRRNIDPRPIWHQPDAWDDYGQPLDEWINACAQSIAQAIIAASSILDFGTTIIDGSFPDWVRRRIVSATKEALEQHDLQGIITPQVIEGALGSDARALGGAALPLFSRYLLDQNVLLKKQDNAEPHQ
jgi:predicted NBD/HSP70 family sugar kinase